MTNTCKGCGAEILWRYTERGRAMPLDAEPTAAYRKGTYVLDVDGAHCRAAEPLLDVGVPLHMNHWATCPHAEDFRPGTTGNPARM